MVFKMFLASAVATVASDPVVMMNGQYQIANRAPGAPLPTHRGQYIEVHTIILLFYLIPSCIPQVYSHNITSVYSEVYWTVQPDVPLPADFVAKYRGKAVAFTGYEVSLTLMIGIAQLQRR